MTMWSCCQVYLTAEGSRDGSRHWIIYRDPEIISENLVNAIIIQHVKD